jgi:prepilin-type N-terminal cleavage/methylation domain-containing protein
MNKMKDKKMQKIGFTLIELLVVIAIIALLLSVLVPALKRAKDAAKVAVCLSSVKQLTLAWVAYTGDNNGELIYADDGDGGNQHPAWSPPLYLNGTTKKSYKTQLDELYNGLLFAYINSTKFYRCPSLPESFEVARSYNISQAMNGCSLAFAGETTAPIVKKMSDLRSTGTRLVFIDEYHVTWGAWTAMRTAIANAGSGVIRRRSN